MLLQRLYNWIKYKSLPTSFLFRNRLFIERNTKHRRIYSIFGALMRNSKWGNFELSNVKHQFRFNYTRYLLWTFSLVVLSFLVWFFKKYYAYTYAFNGVALFVWLSVDSFDYYLSFSLWCVTAALALTTNWVYSYFLEQTNLRYPPLRTIFSDAFFEEFNKPEEIEERQLRLSVSDLKYFFYHWISNPQNTNSSIFLEKLFDTEVSKKWWNNYYDFFIRLFKVTYLCNLNNEFHSIKHLHYSLSFLHPPHLNSNLKKLITHKNDLSVLDKYTTILFWYTLRSYSNYSSWKNNHNPSLRLFSIRNKWNLGFFDLEVEKHALFSTGIFGNFYLSSFTFNKLSPFSTNFSELWNFSSFVKNQINAAKWNRWLYKYSILHRRFLRNSHKITLTKRLFSSGFYDNKFFNRNTWNTTHAQKMDKTLLHGLGSIYYKSLFQATTTPVWQVPSPNSTPIFSMKKSIALFSFYENSFLWVAKRFYSFNTTPSNFINTTLSLKGIAKRPQRTLLQTPQTQHSTLMSYLGKSYSFNVGVVDIFSSESKAPLSFSFHTTPCNKSLSFHIKDLHLLFDDDDLLSPETLDIGYWITTNSAGRGNSSKVLAYCGLNHNHFAVEGVSFLQSAAIMQLHESTPRIINFHESCYLADIILISYFY